tara:strand:+ start:397 stop:804 length:408 start_codon:yes stop_codon:yes gene_type:complete
MQHTIISNTLNIEVTEDHLIVETDFFKAAYRWETIIAKANVGGHGYSYDDVAEKLSVRNVNEETAIAADDITITRQEIDVHCPLGDITISKIRVMKDIGWVEVIPADGRHEVVRLTQLASMVSRNNPLPKGVFTH